jgi:hypothetical protein
MNTGIIKPISCPRCKATLFWDNKHKVCLKCFLDIIEQGVTWNSPKDFGVVLQYEKGKLETLLLKGQKLK